jgi:hypothetical protein
MADLDDDDPTEKEILLEIYREVRWIGRFLAVASVLAILIVAFAAFAGAD